MKPEDIFAAIVAALFVIASVTVGATSALMLAWSDARAHQAPTGWNYAADCCSNQDCAPLPRSAVQITPTGYVVTVTPEMNKQIKAPRTYTIAYTATGLRESQDGEYHICLRPEYANNAGEIFGGGVICFYIPPMGF
jgi:hypothetical protein